MTKAHIVSISGVIHLWSIAKYLIGHKNEEYYKGNDSFMNNVSVYVAQGLCFTMKTYPNTGEMDIF